MDPSVSGNYLSCGQRAFAEYRKRVKPLHDPADGDAEAYARNGEDVFQDYTGAPENFPFQSGVTQLDVLVGLGKVENERRYEEEPVTNLLDSLVEMPVEMESESHLLTAENVKYSFEESVPVEAQLLQPVLGRQMKQSEWNENDVRDTEIEAEPPSIEEKQTASEVESTHGSESVHGVRSIDRAERKSNFSVLQEHINVLTEENCDLKRALELQQRLTANLTQENQTLGDEYNIQAHKLEDMQQKCSQYEALLRVQQEAGEALKLGNEQSRAAEQGAQDRVKELVQENVALEDRLRDFRVSGIRLEKTVEKLKEEAEAISRRERKLENENRNLSDILNNIREENNMLRSQIHNPTQRYARAPRSADMKDAEIQTDYLETEKTVSPSPTMASKQDIDSDLMSDEKILRSLRSEEQIELSSEERQVLSSVHELINALDDQRKAMIAKLRAAKVEIQKLRSDNALLTQKISSQTQILEMQVQRGVHNQLAQTSEIQEDASTAVPSPSHVTLVSHSKARHDNSGFLGWFGGRNREKTLSDYMD